MMQNITIINTLINQRHKGTHDLYSKIPYFLRTQLDGAICSELWDLVSERCDLHDPNSLELATNMYQRLLGKVDVYIKTYNQNNQSDMSTMMMVDKNRIEDEFHFDAVRFVSEMAKCLQREKELIFTYHELGDTDGGKLDLGIDNTVTVDNSDLNAILELVQDAENNFSQFRKHSEEHEKYMGITITYLQSLTNGPDNDMVEVDPDEDNLRHISDEFMSLEMSTEQTQTVMLNCKQKGLRASNEASLRCSHYIEKLMKDLEMWKVAEARRSVKVGPESNTATLINRYATLGKTISTAMSWFSDTGHLHVIREKERTESRENMSFSMEVARLQLEFQNIMSRLFQIIVLTQPKGVISIENKGKKDSPNYCTKKTQSFLSSLRILAIECFKDCTILSKEVELVAEKDLAQGSTAGVTGRDGGSCLKVETLTGNTPSDIQFNIEVKNFNRLEQNNVYKQFLRLRYKVKLSVNGKEYCLETMSLPFTFNTGANQILEHMGARMWYLASGTDLYNGSFQCPDPLPADDLINILDNRITYIGTKTRRLTESEKIFLKGRLPVASDGTVTMQGFLKDKMRTLRLDEPMSFSFYTWFYAVSHSIEQPQLLNAWQDGFIFGFCSEKEAEKILMNSKIPEGTLILRPSVSVINKTSSAEATAALVMEIKVRNEDAQPLDGHNSEFNITSIPLFYKHIEENTLYGAIKGMVYHNKPVAKFLYGRDGGKKLDVLKGCEIKHGKEFSSEYKIVMEKMKKFNIRKSSQPASAAADVSEEDEDCQQQTPKRKRKYRKSATTQSQFVSQTPSLPSGMDDSSSGSSTLPFFKELSADFKEEKIQNSQLSSNHATNEQFQRSGSQGKTTLGTSDSTASESIGQMDNLQMPVWSQKTAFGNIQVDVSQISKLAAAAAGYSPDHHSQRVSTSSELMLNGTGHADVYMADSDHSRATPQLYNAHYLDNTNNKNTFSESASNHVDYSVSVTSIPASGVEYSLQDLSSPSNRILSAHLNANLPTVLNEATEFKRQNKRGSGRGNNSSAKKKATRVTSTEATQQSFSQRIDQSTRVTSTEATQQSFSQRIDQSTRPHLQLNQHSLQHSIFSSGDGQGSFIYDSSMLSLSKADYHVYGEIESIDDQTLVLQLSPDSGMGDQSPSPVTTWGGNPILAEFITGSDIIGQFI